MCKLYIRIYIIVQNFLGIVHRYTLISTSSHFASLAQFSKQFPIEYYG